MIKSRTTLGRLVKYISSKKIFGEINLKISSISPDSRATTSGSLYVAIKGMHFDGHTAIEDVIKKGAIAIIGEKKPKRTWLKATYIWVKDSREALGLMASAWYHNPSKEMKIIGITGTDGKTTTSNLLWWILKNSGKKAGLVSTISAKIGNKELDTGFHVTNPESLDLQQYLSLMNDAKCKYAVLEVTSQGIAQKRIAGIDFDIAVLTNITHDHLDYHENFKKYRDAKTKLFEKAKTVIINKDDPSFRYIVHKTEASKVITYSLSKRADYKARILEVTLEGMGFEILNHNATIPIKTLLVGNYNISNILAAVSTARYYGCSWKNIQSALETFPRPEGRLQEIKNTTGIRIFVDFAHTPNSMELILKQFKEHVRGKLIVVFGCAGERDGEKRILMPATSVKFADISVFTAEDPRSENINDILNVMGKSAIKHGGILIKHTNDSTNKHWGNKQAKHFFALIPERGEAIYNVINKIAYKDDIILICGKGHEKSMAYNGIEYEWSDKKAVQMALKGKVLSIQRD